MITLDPKDMILLTLFLVTAQDHYRKEAESPTLDEANRKAAANFADEAERLSRKFEDAIMAADADHDSVMDEVKA